MLALLIELVLIALSLNQSTTIMSVSINYLAVLVAGFIPMILGSIWYGPLFGKKWIELMGLTEEELKANFNPI